MERYILKKLSKKNDRNNFNRVLDDNRVLMIFIEHSDIFESLRH